MSATVETLLECSTLSAWVDQSRVTDGAALYEQLRESLSAVQLDYRNALARGWRGQADADAAMDEIGALTLLLDIVLDGLDWHRGRYRAQGRPWPLSRLMIWCAAGRLLPRSHGLVMACFGLTA
jgi:hypothetical protein